MDLIMDAIFVKFGNVTLSIGKCHSDEDPFPFSVNIILNGDGYSRSMRLQGFKTIEEASKLINILADEDSQVTAKSLKEALGEKKKEYD